MSILLTGGLGYIGSHCAVELLKENYDIVIVDCQYNSDAKIISKIREITEKDFSYYNVDISHPSKLAYVFEQHKISAVMHFAAHKIVPESVEQPLPYYYNNVLGTIMLMRVMEKFGVRKMIFSSSASVYGNAEKMPVTEETSVNPLSPYAESKRMCEKLLEDCTTNFDTVILRYFNPGGCHDSFKLGEELTPYRSLIQTLSYNFVYPSLFTINGTDYKTRDGTAIRDFIHIMDLTRGHLAALRKVKLLDQQCEIYNLGSGKGFSVREMILAFEKASQKKIEIKEGPRRKGDVSEVYCSYEKAKRELNWKPRYNLKLIAMTAYQWLMICRREQEFKSYERREEVNEKLKELGNEYALDILPTLAELEKIEISKTPENKE